MTQQRLEATIDPPHINEFASERYFEKLHQLNTSQQQCQTTPLGSPAASAFISTPTFILPLRDSKTTEPDTVKPTEQKRDKSRFFGLRHKISVVHPKAHNVNHEPYPQTGKSAESTRKSPPLHALFIALPVELQAQILSFLPLIDVLNLRQTAKTWHTLVTLNKSTIVRYHLDHHIPAYALRLYPVSDSTDFTLHHLCSLWHRLHVATKLAFLMCEWITKDIFLRQTDAQRASFAPQHERMRHRLIPLLFTVFHFFETYRFLHLKHLTDINGHDLQRYPYTVNPIEREIMNILRPPTYAGHVERSLRGYLRERPSDEVHAAILCIGGLRQVERLWETKGYNCRRTAIDNWFNGLTKGAATESSTNMRLGLKSFDRKKSMIGERPMVRSSVGGGWAKSKYSTTFVDAYSSNEPLDVNWVFDSSLTADLPMAPLNTEQAQLLLGDLPVLQQIWLTTAEAMILDRGIVQRMQDIKRNQQVMLDLIREHRIDDEYEWSYSRSIPDSVRLPPGATDDDAD